MLISLILFSAACGKHETSAANANSNVVNLKADQSTNQKSEQAAAPQSLKAPEPCGWFEKSLGLKPEEYKELSGTPGTFACGQGKGLVNYSAVTYNVTGDATTVKELYIGVTIRPQNTEKQKADLIKLVAGAANQIAEKTGGQKITEEIIAALLMGEEKEFDLAPGEDKTKPQLKTAFVNNTMGGFYKPASYRSVTFKF